MNFFNYDEVLADPTFQEDLAKGEDWSVSDWHQVTINWDLGNIKFIKLHRDRTYPERQQLIREGFDLFGAGDPARWGFFMMLALSLSDAAFGKLIEALD